MTTVGKPMRNHFLNRLRCTPLPDGEHWEGLAPLHYVAPDGRHICVPKGFVSDFASIPPLATIGGAVLAVAWVLAQWWPGFYGLALFAWVVILLANSLEHTGTYDEAAFIHDYLYTVQTMYRWQADWVLFKAMAASGAGRTPLWKRLIIYGGVRIGGWWRWEKKFNPALVWPHVEGKKK